MINLPHMLISVVVTVGFVLGIQSGEAMATPPALSPAASDNGAELDDVRRQAIDSYVVRRGLKPRAEAARGVRKNLELMAPGLASAEAIKGAAVRGTVEIPVFTMTFADTGGIPYAVDDLKTELFDGPWQSGTMSDHYREMSRGLLSVEGEVFEWVRLRNPESHYAGPPGCSGRCLNARIGDMITEILDVMDGQVDFRRFDNDGPDNIPNSEDDDGYVDFVAFVHPSIGGECGRNDSIWSHRYSYAGWTGRPYRSQDRGRGGNNILIDDYVVMPALACDGRTMVQIGVFSHEFGHAFGLPDLYDAKAPVQSAGIGGWGLMASGSYGGDGSSMPEAPSHMTAWSKEYLGWISPEVIDSDRLGVRIRPILTTGRAVRVDYSPSADPEDKKYLLLEYRTQDGFDRSLETGGLLVTEINNERVQSGLVSNTVNASPFDMGVNVIEADGRRELDRHPEPRGDANDVFPGGRGVASADISHPEKPRAALCNIKQMPDFVELDIYVSRTTCPGAIASAAVSVAAVASGDVVIGEDVVIEGVLSNEGRNYFVDRKLVLSGVGNSGNLPVTAPEVLSAIQPKAAESADAARPTLADLLGKKVILRGRLVRETQEGTGELAPVLFVEEYQIGQ